MDAFEELKQSRAELARLEEMARRPRFSLREHRRRQREALLPDNRMCPVCGFVKVNSRAWVDVRHVHDVQLPSEARRAGVVCKSCYCRYTSRLRAEENK